MSSDEFAVKVDGVSKLYRIGLKDETHDTLASSMWSFARAPLANYQRYRSLYNFDDIDVERRENTQDVLWALKDVSFDVRRGELIGIIGMNGAGKSTLLKILARITPPTTGRVEIHGRVSSLLEVGTGFHPELSGRDNVYLNGTVLGMTKKEIDRKFDAIVDFSGVEKFIDTPVKRYSSGMGVRLAFAVAAHLEPEILIVDEVLAVGDAAFQRKCINKMRDVGQLGTTVLFVSHSMPSVTRLCTRAVLLADGKVDMDGPTNDVVSAYLSVGLGISPERVWDDPQSAPGDDVVRLRSLRVRSKEGRTLDTADVRNPIGIEIQYDVAVGGHLLLPNINFYDEEGSHLFTTLEQDPHWRSKPRPSGRYTSTAWIPGNLLSEGMLYVEPAMMTTTPFRAHFSVRDAVGVQVFDLGEGDSARGDWNGPMLGAFRPMLNWQTEQCCPIV